MKKILSLGTLALAGVLAFTGCGKSDGLTEEEAIKYAELNISGGEKKKEYVLCKVEEKCEELGIPYTFIKKLVKKLVDRVVANYNVIKK